MNLQDLLTIGISNGRAMMQKAS